MTHCYATTKSGRPCRAHHVNGSPYCFWHHPSEAYASRRKRASAKGGRATLSDMEKNEEMRESRRRVAALDETIAHLKRLVGMR